MVSLRMPRDTIRMPSLPSGRFVIRIDPALHASLREGARAAGTSLNRYCARKLAAPGGPMDPAAVAVMERADKVLGSLLTGVVAFGSWVRGEESAASDLDVLVIADARAAITRDLYRRWDAGPRLEWDGHRVEPHFVHLPPGHAPISGLWAEVAMDGVVLYQRKYAVSRRLAGLRRRVLEGEVSLHRTAGQSYWVRDS